MRSMDAAIAPIHDVSVAGGGGPLDVLVGTPVSIFGASATRAIRRRPPIVSTYAGSILIARNRHGPPCLRVEKLVLHLGHVEVTPDRTLLRFEASPVANETDLNDNIVTQSPPRPSSLRQSRRACRRIHPVRT